MSHKPAHLLLVDDDPGLLKLLGLRLTSEGYSVVTAESGAEGLRVLNREKGDLVFSELRRDEMYGMQLFAEIQTSEGYSVVTAESGAEGLRVLNREKGDLVFSELRRDEMYGMQLFAEIQKVQPGMPVIILTAHGSIPDAVAATQQGVFSFLTKPVDFLMPLLQHSRACSVFSPSLSIKMRYIRQLTMRWNNPRQPPTNVGARRLSPAAR